MYKNLIRISCGLLFLLFASSTYAQNVKNIDITMTEVSRADIIELGDIQINASHGRIYQIDVPAFKQELVGISHREVPQSGFVV